MAAYEVLAVRYGTRTTTRSETFLNFHVYGEPDAAIPMDYYFWVVRDGRRTIVVDCGFGAGPGARRRRTMLADPVEALAGLGIDAATVDTLVVTHAHYDHIGNLAAFPAAEIVLARRELEFWTGPYAGRLQFAHSTEADELRLLADAAAAGRVRLVEDTLDLAPGFELVVVGGHTPGQMVARVATGDGGAVLAADALHLYEELERDRPFFVVADLVGMYRGFDVLGEMAQDPGHVLVAGHDAAVPERFPGRLDGLPGPLGDLVVRVAPGTEEP